MRISFLFAGLVFFSACKKNSDTAVNNPSQASTLLDVSYGTDAKQKMDIYLPAGRTADSTKLVFLIHGGGWTEGDKSDFSPSVAYLQTLLPGYAIINTNYRLVTNGQNIFPAQENDIKAAATFIYNKRNEYQVSGTWAFMGASAGAHLAMQQSYKYSSPVKPKAVVAFFGPSDLTALFNSSNPLLAPLLVNVTGTTPSVNAVLYQQSSPVNFITAQSPPTILFHGGADPLVPPNQSELVRNKLQSFSVPVQYVFYPGEGHGWQGPDLLDSFNKTAAFLQLYMK